MKFRSCWVAASAAIALGATGCGSGDDGEATRSVADPPPALGRGLGPEVRHPVTAAIDRLQRAFVANDHDGVCAGMTRAAARQAGMAAHGTPTTCRRDVRRLLGMIREGGGWRHRGAPRVVDVEVDGSRAVATVGLDRRWQATIPLTRERGRWRLSGFFGTAPREIEQITDAVPGGSFPPAGDDPVQATDREGRPCPKLSEAAYPKVSGGCAVKLSGRIAPLTIVTALGDFRFDRCSIEYRVRIDSSGRTWTEALQVEGGPKSVACGDVNACPDYALKQFAPWRGRIHSDGEDGFVHRMDMCMATCVGNFVGELAVRLVRDDDGWRAEPIDGGGSSGFRFESPLTGSGDLDLGTAGA